MRHRLGDKGIAERVGGQVTGGAEQDQHEDKVAVEAEGERAGAQHQAAEDKVEHREDNDGIEQVEQQHVDGVELDEADFQAGEEALQPHHCALDGDDQEAVEDQQMEEARQPPLQHLGLGNDEDDEIPGPPPVVAEVGGLAHADEGY